MRTAIDEHLQMEFTSSDYGMISMGLAVSSSSTDDVGLTVSPTASDDLHNFNSSSSNTDSIISASREALERHPLEAHLMQLELEEIDRPPVYNASKLAPEIILSADSLKQDAKSLGRILVTFLAYAIKTHGTTGNIAIASFGRFEQWQGRPAEAEKLAATTLNEKNLIYQKALKYAKADMTERGLWVRRFSLREEKKKCRITVEWVVEFSGAYKQQISHTDIFEQHRELHDRNTPSQSPGHSRAASLAASRHVSNMSTNTQGWYGDEPPLTSAYMTNTPYTPTTYASLSYADPLSSYPPLPANPPPPPPTTTLSTVPSIERVTRGYRNGDPHPQYPHHYSVGQLSSSVSPTAGTGPSRHDSHNSRGSGSKSDAAGCILM